MKSRVYVSLPFDNSYRINLYHVFVSRDFEIVFLSFAVLRLITLVYDPCSLKILDVLNRNQKF